ncbi:MAG: glycosyltransferase family 4 protein [Planctomycetaceae bacterium]|nr:glycosyltransferase family 4 protein [Planctomycetaceae bacterium]MCB9951654.1 glycosyltransferase family 4 protein [Planctomycetaceae bacterium]
MGFSSHQPATQRATANGDLLTRRDELQGDLHQLVGRHPLIENNLACIEAALGNIEGAAATFDQIEPTSDVERDTIAHNLSELQRFRRIESNGASANDRSPRRRVAVVSLLFNWPSTGGGTVHTKELCDFLFRAGYDVRHFYAVNNQWDVGNVRRVLPYPSVPLRFGERDWNEESIKERFREAVGEYRPDSVIVTSSWNTKPLLAEAVAEFPYFIRIAALESICPLNNVRLLLDEQRQPVQCDGNQLSDAKRCRACVSVNHQLSGGLHQAERKLAGFDHDDYSKRLTGAFAKAEGVLVVNPKIAELITPYTRNVHVVPSGFDISRFPASLTEPPSGRPRKRMLFAGLTQELMKGFFVLAEAGITLWKQRQDFEIVVTGDPIEGLDEPFRFVGWQSQEHLPALIGDCDFLVFPTVAQEALGRTAVEAMGCGRPVVASDIGGLSWVVEDGVTGLLCRPGDAGDLSEKLGTMLDSREQRIQFGINGRKKFEVQFTWDQILKRHYVKVLGTPELEPLTV